MIWITLCQPTLPPPIFYACQPNAVMTTCVASLLNKTQISLWWLRSLMHCSTEAILLKASHSGGGGGVDRLDRTQYWCLHCCFSAALPRFFPPHCGKRDDAVIKVSLGGGLTCWWLSFVCQFRGLSCSMRSLSLDHRDLRAHRSFAFSLPRAQIVSAALFWNMMEMCWTNLALAGLAEY